MAAAKLEIAPQGKLILPRIPVIWKPDVWHIAGQSR
jgi:hypothetical protein